eukprot:SAG31_NODE_11983_length_980_cov_1.032917_1_plen_326_part_11
MPKLEVGITYITSGENVPLRLTDCKPIIDATTDVVDAGAAADKGANYLEALLWYQLAVHWTDGVLEAKVGKKEIKKHQKLTNKAADRGEQLASRLENLEKNVVGEEWSNALWQVFLNIVEVGGDSTMKTEADSSVTSASKSASVDNAVTAPSVAASAVVAVANVDHARSKPKKRKAAGSRSAKGGGQKPTNGQTKRKNLTVEITIDEDFVPGQKVQPEGMKVMRIPKDAKPGQKIRFNIKDGSLYIAPEAPKGKTGPNVLQVIVPADPNNPKKVKSGWSRNSVVQVEDPRVPGRVFYCKVPGYMNCMDSFLSPGQKLYYLVKPPTA